MAANAVISVGVVRYIHMRISMIIFLQIPRRTMNVAVLRTILRTCMVCVRIESANLLDCIDASLTSRARVRFLKLRDFVLGNNYKQWAHYIRTRLVQ